MGAVGIIGLDSAKIVFPAHGAAADGAVVFCRKLTRAQVLKLIAAQPFCVVAMAACAMPHQRRIISPAHHRGRLAQAHGSWTLRLVPAVHVKPVVKRQKNARDMIVRMRRPARKRRCARTCGL